jgi:thiol-disulfide isomerase/thioredoxin
VAWDCGYRYANSRVRPKEHTEALKLIRAVVDAHPDRAARAWAYGGLARYTHCQFAVSEYDRGPHTDRFAAEAEEVHRQLVARYGDDLSPGGRKFGEIGRGVLYELRNLRVGKVAPDIVGDDLDGKRFKLSDSRGKVTLLVFWGSWCGPCMALVPQERALAVRYAGRPFAIVGVNSDGDRAKARETTDRDKMTWRSFWNGADGPDGPISTAWNIHGWPTLYLIDAAGVIRYRDIYRNDLDKAVADLLAELEKK